MMGFVCEMKCQRGGTRSGELVLLARSVAGVTTWGSSGLVWTAALCIRSVSAEKLNRVKEPFLREVLLVLLPGVPPSFS